MSPASSRRAGEASGRVEQHLRAIIDTIPTLVWSARPDGTAEFLNQRWLDYTGLTAAQAAGWGWTVALHPDDRVRLIEYWQRMLGAGESGEIEARMRRADGEYRWFLFRGQPLRDAAGAIVGWCGTNTDIDERKRAEDAARLSEHDTRLILDSIPGHVAIMSPAGEIEMVNKPIRDYAARTLEELKNWKSNDSVHPDDLPRVIAAWRYSITTGHPLEYEHRLRGADGVYRWFYLRGLPLRDSAGAIIRWYVLLTDVNDRKNAEEALRGTQARLSRAAQIATVGELAASIAHEVNQPLAAVVANGHACLRWLSTPTPNVAKALEAAERIVRDGKEAGEVVRRVRSLFKRAAAERMSLDVNDLIGEVLRVLDVERVRKDVSVETDLARDLPPVLGDRVELQQLVLNLLVNGLDAMDSVTDRPRQLFIRSTRHNDVMARVEIRDNGSGLEDPARVFEAFFTTKPNGLGMGLVICRSIVDAHGGQLWATASDPPGSTFCFTLPFWPTPPHER